MQRSVKPGDSVKVGLRAEEFRFADDASGYAAPATILAALPTGTDWYYRVRVGNAELTVRENDHPNLASGAEINLQALPNPIKVFG